MGKPDAWESRLEASCVGKPAGSRLYIPLPKRGYRVAALFWAGTRLLGVFHA
ncbi:MAG: hypothetical protein K6U11_07520 [bacterium]|nr:hypothetical protein [bacterium]